MFLFFFQLSSSESGRKNNERCTHPDIAKPYGSPSDFLLSANLPSKIKSAKFYIRAGLVEKLEIVKSQFVAAEFFAPSFCGEAAKCVRTIFRILHQNKSPDISGLLYFVII